MYKQNQSRYAAGQEIVPGYTLVKTLGQGMAGQVWVARHAGGMNVAIKIVPLQDIGGLKELKALKTIRNVRHSNLCSIFGFWLRDEDGRLLDEDEMEAQLDELRVESRPEAGTMSINVPHLAPDLTGQSLRADELIIAMQLGDGTLYDRLLEIRRAHQLTDNPDDPDYKVHSQTPCGMDAAEALGYLRGAASAIDELHHKHNIKHCDIKPQNILLLGGGVQVCDFGLANRFEGDARKTTHAFATPAYSSPEVHEHATYTESLDQYSLAVTYFEIRTGLFPFSTTSQVKMLHSKVHSDFDFQHVSAPERKVLQKALSADPSRRYQSCVDLIDALSEATQAKKSRTSQFVWATLIAAALGIAIFFASKPSPLPPPPDRGGDPPTPAVLSINGEIDGKSDLRIKAGDNAALNLVLAPADRGKPNWTFDPPAGIDVIRQESSSADRSNNLSVFKLHTDLGLPPATYDLTFEVTVDGETAKHMVNVNVELPDSIRIPTGFGKAADAKLVKASEDGDRVYWNEIIPEHISDDIRPFVRFRCIPRTHRDDPPTYYIMLDVVTNSVFDAFIEASGSPPESDQWRDKQWRQQARDNPALPAVEVSAIDAESCARWLGGISLAALPTREQWLKAAGYFDFYERADRSADQDLPEGPFEPGKNVAVDRAGPVAVGSSDGDRSPLFGIHDMAGNVREWARVDDNPSGFHLVLGESFDDAKPFRYESYYQRFKEGDSRLFDSSTKDDLGFRAAVEIFD